MIPIGRFERVGVVPTRRDNIWVFPAFFCMPMCTHVRIRHPFLVKLKIIIFHNSVLITVGNCLGHSGALDYYIERRDDDTNDRIVVCTDRTDLKIRRQTKCLGYARLLIRADACARRYAHAFSTLLVV